MESYQKLSLSYEKLLQELKENKPTGTENTGKESRY